MFWKVLGTVLLLKFGISLTQFLWLMLKLYILPKFGFKLNLKKYGDWAVVTGATDGIGKAVAKQLAKRGMNLVLISRSEEKLKATADEIETESVKVKTISFDFNKSDFEKIESELKDMNIGVLVNNVGVSYDHPDYYLNYSAEFYDSMVNINIRSVLQMTRIVLDGMVKRQKGLVMHVSSAAALIPLPFVTVYSASKVFVDYFGRALHYEYRSLGIKSQVVTPRFVATKMSKMRPNGITVPNADGYAKQMVDAIGLSPAMTGCWGHELTVYARYALLPYSFTMNYLYKVSNELRKGWLQQQEQKKE